MPPSETHSAISTIPSAYRSPTPIRCLSMTTPQLCLLSVEFAKLQCSYRTKPTPARPPCCEIIDLRTDHWLPDVHPPGGYDWPGGRKTKQSRPAALAAYKLWSAIASSDSTVADLSSESKMVAPMLQLSVNWTPSAQTCMLEIEAWRLANLCSIASRGTSVRTNRNSSPP